MDKVLTKEEWKRRRKIKRYVRLGIVCLVAFIILIVAILGLKALFGSVFSKDKLSKKAEAIKAELNIAEKYIEKSDYTRSGDTLKKVEGVVIHYVGVSEQTAAQRHTYYNTMKDNEEKQIGSTHYIVGFGGEIIQCIPLDEIAYASKHRNVDTIAIEYVHNDFDGEPEEDTYDAMVKLTAFLVEQYNLKMENVMLHYEATTYPCPPYYVDNPSKWDQFKKDVQGVLNAANKK